jgi:EAL domain-containing protein (putative c-di-GMP-specific phosphodiesterase class I)
MLCSGRLEGAEFFSAIYVEPTRTPVSLVDEYLSELENAFTVSELKITLDISAGVSLYPENGESADTLLRRTSIALDAARKDKQRIHCYEDGEDEMHMQRLAMIESLRKVILSGGGGELFMVYQPKVHLDGHEDMRAEALIRWRRDNNFVSPELFVNLAEEASLIIDLTHWVFNTVLKQLQEWHKEGHRFSAAINVSAQDLAHPSFEGFVRDCCQRYGIEPKYVTIEITERDIMHDEATVVMALRSLKQSGFTIAIDDYGIGQSSLAKLKGLPVDEIKLDKTFIMHLDQSPKDQLIVRSTIEMAHGLGFEVVAEGVENIESLTLLKQFQCNQVQGYYISKPITADAVAEWQKNHVEEPSQIRTIINSRHSQWR